MHALGVPDATLRTAASPIALVGQSNTATKLERETAQKLVDGGAEWLLCRKGNSLDDSSDATRVMCINDSASLTRESQLKKIFAKHGVTLEFI